MFSIEKGKFGSFSKAILKNLDTNESVSIIPGFGGTVNELLLSKGGVLHSIIDGCLTTVEMKENIWSKSNKLIPFPNRVEDGKYSWNEVVYELEIDLPLQNHAIHGFIKNKKMKVIKEVADERMASITLAYEHKGSTRGYPFKFYVEIVYTLHKGGFACQTMVENKDNVDIPMGDGWHPYFRTGSHIGRLYLKLPSKEIVEADNRQIPTGEKMPFTEFNKERLIGDKSFDDCFTVEGKDTASTEIFDKDKNLRIRLWQETGDKKYNFVQLFTTPSRSTIAIEPMTCNVNAFNNQDGLIALSPKESFRASYGVSLA